MKFLGLLVLASILGNAFEAKAQLVQECQLYHYSYDTKAFGQVLITRHSDGSAPAAQLLQANCKSPEGKLDANGAEPFDYFARTLCRTNPGEVKFVKSNILQTYLSGGSYSYDTGFRRRIDCAPAVTIDLPKHLYVTSLGGYVKRISVTAKKTSGTSVKIKLRVQLPDSTWKVVSWGIDESPYLSVLNREYTKDVYLSKDILAYQFFLEGQNNPAAEITAATMTYGTGAY